MAIITSIEDDDHFERLGSCTSGLAGVRTRVDVAELVIGMRVDALDKPWLESRFLFQGFFIDTQDDLDALREECRFVYVSVTQSIGQPSPSKNRRKSASNSKIYGWPTGEVYRK